MKSLSATFGADRLWRPARFVANDLERVRVIEEAAIELGLPLKKIEYELLEQGSRGVLGVGKKPFALIAYPARQAAELDPIAALRSEIEGWITAAGGSGASSPTMDLELSTDGGAAWTPLATGLAMDRWGQGSYLWTAGPESTQALVRVTANQGEYWIAVDGNYLVKYTLLVEMRSSEDEAARLEFSAELTQVNQPIDISFPQGCLDAKANPSDE